MTNFPTFETTTVLYKVPPPGTKILFASVPADGHFNPLTGLAMHLKSLGCDVRWYTSGSYAAKLHRLDIQPYFFKRALEVNAGDIDTAMPERNKIRSQVKKLVFDMTNFFILRSTEYYEDIREIREEFQFDVFVSDIAFSAVPLVKEKLKVPVITLGIFPLVETSKDLGPAGLGLTPSNSAWGRFRQGLLRYAADHFLFARPNALMQSILTSYGVDAGGSNVFDIIVKKSSLVLQSGTPGFEYKRSDLGKNIRFIGALLPYTNRKNSVRWYDERLKQYEKVILVTQGTVEKDTEKLIVPTLEAFRDTDYLVIATTGGADTQALREKFPYDNIIIEDFIPFNEIMPYAHIYVTNGGYGGVMMAIEHGLPMVVGGIHEGKNEINARIGYFGLGINLKTENPDVDHLRNSIEEVLWNNEFERKVKKLGKEFHSYQPNTLFASYVAELVHKKEKAARKSRPVEWTELVN